MKVFVPRAAPTPDDAAAVDVELLAFADELVTTGEMPATGVSDSPFAYEFCGVCAGTSSFSTFPSRTAAIRATVTMFAGGHAELATRLLLATMNQHPAGLYTVLAGHPDTLATAGVSVGVLTDVLVESVAADGRSLFAAVRAVRKFDQLSAKNMVGFYSQQPADLIVDVVEFVALRARFVGRPEGFAVLQVLVRDAGEIPRSKFDSFVQTALTF